LLEPEERAMTEVAEISARADFSMVRYAQCWEDARILLAALQIRPGDRCLSIASAGDNTLALLSRGPQQVIALDLSPAQLACLELRVAAFRRLEHGELLQLLGYRPCPDRRDLYRRCRGRLSPTVRAFWDARPEEVAGGIANCGKFERYLALFRNYVLSLVHPPDRVARLLAGGSAAARRAFYEREWDTWRWRWLFRIFCSRFALGRLGRDPSFFAYVEGRVADRLLARARYAMTTLDPSTNPYLQWILAGPRTGVLPFAFRPENFAAIRDNLDALEWRLQSLEAFLDQTGPRCIDRFNLSDIFEYMSPERYHQLLGQLVRTGRPGGRLAYWNMLVPRRRPAQLAGRLMRLDSLSRRLHQQDRAFFYGDFVVEEILA
jgi:S-adenosylmethionine-diacylglycerol 3-amino-3-carboxypropyl transferase